MTHLIQTSMHGSANIHARVNKHDGSLLSEFRNSQMYRCPHIVNMKSCNTHCNTHCNKLQYTVKHGSLPSEPRRKNVSAQVKSLHLWLTEAVPLATPPRSPPLHTHTHTHTPPLLNHNLSQVELVKSQALHRKVRPYIN